MTDADSETSTALLGHETEENSNGIIELNTIHHQGKATGSSANSSSMAGSSLILDIVKRKKKTQDELIEACRRESDKVNFCDEEDNKTALHHAALNGEKDIVQILLDFGADIKYKDSDGNTALHLAVESGENAADIFKLLLPPKEKLQKMRVWDTHSFRCASGNAACGMHFRNGAEHWMDTATSNNNAGFNVLDLALKNMHIQKRQIITGPLREIVEYIVRETDDEYFLRLMRNKDRGGKHSTPMRNLIKKIPDIAKEVLDRCIQQGTGTVLFHYELLDDMYLLNTWPPSQKDYCQNYYQHVWERLPSKDAHTQTNPFRRLKTVVRNEMKDIEDYKPYTKVAKKLKNNSPLMLMIKCKRKDTRQDGMYQELLDHPLVKALAKRKWNHIGIKFHVLNLILYLIYLVIFTTCVVTATPPYIHPRNSTIKTSTICQDGTSCQGNSSQPPQLLEKNDRPIFVAGKYSICVCILAMIMILKEIYQLLKMYGCRGYFKRIENYVELAVYVSSVIFVVNVTGSREAEYTENWQWLLGTFSGFMAWINLLSFAKKFDTFGIYVGMFWRIIKTFLKNVFLIVLILIVAFAVGFNCVRRHKHEFGDFWRSILVTSSMMINGVDYDREEFESLVDHIDVATATFIFYSLFLVVMTIIIINLMVGVAVDNVQEIQKRATDSNSIFQIEYCLEFEAILVSIIERFNWTTTFKKWFVLNPTEEIWLRHLKPAASGLPAYAVKEILRLIKADKVSQTESVGKQEILDIKEELVNLKNAVEAINRKRH